MDEAIGAMRRLIYGNWQTCVVRAFAELGLADQLDRAGKISRSAEELAAAAGADAGALERLLRCCARLGLVRREPDGRRFALTPFGALLCADHPQSLRDAARLNGAPYRYLPWGSLVEVVRAGHGRGLAPTQESGTLAYLRDKPDELAVFQRAMSELSQGEDEVLARAWEFAAHERVVDVGGGRGGFLRALLAAHPRLQGTLYDLPEVLALDGGGAGDGDGDARLERRAGDFFRGVPEGGDVYVLKNVLHNWPEADALRLLERVREAMAASPGAARRRLLVIEFLIGDDGDATADWLDLNFLVLVGGAERSLDGYRELAARARLALVRAIPTATGRQILELAVAG